MDECARSAPASAGNDHIGVRSYVLDSARSPGHGWPIQQRNGEDTLLTPRAIRGTVTIV
jgi:hypothetical protein